MTATLPSLIAFFVLSSAAGYMLVRAKGQWFLKSIIIVVLPLLAFTHWKSLASYPGWPEMREVEEIPDQIIFFGAEIVEGNKQKNTEGRIRFLWHPMDYLFETEPEFDWLNPFAYLGKGNPARYWDVPYHRSLHEAMNQATQQFLANNKKAVIGRKGKGQGQGEGKEGEGEGQGKKGKQGKKGDGRGKGSHSREQEFHAYPLPPPKPPSKD